MNRVGRRTFAAAVAMRVRRARPSRPYSSGSAKCMLRTVLAVLLALTLLPVLAGPAGADVPQASFDWSMPERFGPDRNKDHLRDYVDGATDAVTGYDATPSSWRVNLNACASNPSTDVTFHWRLLDQPHPASPILVQGGPTCDGFFLEVPEEGSYRVELKVEQADVLSAPLVQEVVVQDWLIVSVGDSYGSGEGAPDIPIDQSKLTEADAAWKEASAKLDALTTVTASADALYVAIGDWQSSLGKVHQYCIIEQDEARCTEWSAIAAVHGAFVVGELIKLGWAAAVETVQDAYAAVEAAVAAARSSWEAAVQVAESVTGELSAKWQSERCHRSSNAGSAQAAKALEDLDPRTSVTFVHLACSGATMLYGLRGYYQGTEHPEGIDNKVCNPDDPNLPRPTPPSIPPADCIRPQLDVAKEIVGGREVDAVYVSIGGNDAHFADIVIACVLQEPCDNPTVVNDPAAFLRDFCPTFLNMPPFGHLLAAKCYEFLGPETPPMDNAAQLLEEGINGDVRPEIDPNFPGLATGYSRLNSALVGDSGLVKASDSNRVFLSEYVDAVRDDNGNLCDSPTMGLNAIPGMSAAESEYVVNTISPTLTQAIEAATVAHGWTFVNGIYNGFTNHGYCAEDHYLVRLQETFLNQGRYQGMVHPNTAGYAKYADPILEKWKSAFYPTGALTAPRRPDQAPFADAGGPWTVNEGASVALQNQSRDSDGDPLTYAWSTDRPGAAAFDDPAAPAPGLQGIDDTSGTVTLDLSDEDGRRQDHAPFTVRNVAPTISRVDGPLSPVMIGTPATVSAPFTDAGTTDTHTVSWEWGDGTTSSGTTTTASGAGTAEGTHTYAATGVYTVTATVTDDDGGRDSKSFQYVVVFDPEGGFVTGGGWITSPIGAYTPGDATDPDIVGQALFAFVSKYKPGAVVPDGNTTFKFKAAGLTFESTSYDWLVISGAKAQYKGTGAVNGLDGFRFILSAVDGDATPQASPDRFRIKIWNASTGSVLYDNQAGEAEDAEARTAIGAGQITVQGPKP